MRYVISATLLLAATLVVAAPIRAAETTSGIYLTADDFKNGKVAFEGWDSDSSHKLQLHDVLDKSYIHVKHENETKKYEKSAVYGFRDSDGVSYRFVGNKEYKILEGKTLSIYSVDSQVPARNRGSGSVYYFSVGAAGKVTPLTVADLKKALPNDHKFHDSLDATFKSNSELNQYDDLHKMYKVNVLLVPPSDR